MLFFTKSAVNNVNTFGGNDGFLPKTMKKKNFNFHSIFMNTRSLEDFIHFIMKKIH